MKVTRILQLVGGVAVLAVALWISLHTLSINASAGNKTGSGDLLLLFLMVIAPALMFALGSYLQAVKLKRWPFALVLLGGIATCILIGGNFMFLFLYMGDKSAQLVVLADLCFVLFTGCAAIVNLVLNKAPTP